MLVVLVNRKEIQANKNTLKVFQPRHTIMSADACYAKIENEMNGLEVYDFKDFMTCAHKAKCIHIVREPQDIHTWRSGVSHFLLNKMPERPKPVPMVYMTFH